ncbi:hypothetical protein [Phaeobacter inhibens]|uniref:hypothetical protein n=1 Tax=Phaeobacter inhibens TaxID=221822 RepID=UPI0021A3705D|nr:hypothetical protein [Phaeobacter inhibens]UWR41545.1 hypothetical protein K4F85_01160 [Phaeobacter inhibens]UWR74083.1 hypothetical protein K4L00_08260 [Phaeobacter inhibens]
MAIQITPEDLAQAFVQADDELHGSQQGYFDFDNPSSSIIDSGYIDLVRIADILNQKVTQREGE